MKTAVALGLVALFAGSPLCAAEVSLAIKNHAFVPAEVHAPANQALTITVKNLDATAAEFESKTLRVEKVVPPNGQVSMQVRPLNAGRYRFMDDFHQDAIGELVVE
jgi:hypothetical protein